MGRITPSSSIVPPFVLDRDRLFADLLSELLQSCSSSVREDDHSLCYFSAEEEDLCPRPSGVHVHSLPSLGGVAVVAPVVVSRKSVSDFPVLSIPALGFRAGLPMDLVTELFAPSFQIVPGSVLVEGWCLSATTTGEQELIPSVGPGAIFRGLLAGVAVTFMVDSGSQVNLISQQFCEENPHLRIGEGSLNLRFGNGERASTVGQLSKVSLRCQGRTDILDQIAISPFHLGSVDLLLGTPFLTSSRGGVFCDPLPNVRFPTGGAWHSVEGLGGFDACQADIRFIEGKSAKAFLKKNGDSVDVFAIQLSSLLESSGLSPKNAAEELRASAAEGLVHPALAALRDEFADVCRDQLPTAVERSAGTTEFLPESVLKVPLLPGTVPKRFRPIPLSHGEQLVMSELLAELLEKNFIEEGNPHCGWSAPVFLLRKPGNREGTAVNKFRLLCDLRGLNSCIVPETYFPPDIAQLIRELSGASIFSSFDALCGYQQMELHEDSRDLTTFSVHLPGSGLRHYRYRSVCLGIQNAVGKFQQWSERVVHGLSRTGSVVKVYIDDIICASSSLADHVAVVRQVLERCRRFGVYLSRKKCVWGQPQLTFLGFRISKDCLEIAEEKKVALREYAVPKSFAQVRRFVGFCVYLSQHIPHFSGTVAPLTSLLKDDGAKGRPRKKFVWTSSCQHAFDAVREAILAASGLFIPVAGAQYSIECDASGAGLGCGLWQTVDGIYTPIWFASHKVSSAESNYPPRSQEMLAVIFALKKYRSYIALTHVHVFSDHESLAGFLTQPSRCARDARWQSLLGEFRFTQFYRAGAEMLVADALSRATEDLTSPPGVMDFIEQHSYPSEKSWSSVDLGSVEARTRSGSVPVMSVGVAHQRKCNASDTRKSDEKSYDCRMYMTSTGYLTIRCI